MHRSSAVGVAMTYDRTLSRRRGTEAQESELSGRTVLDCFYLYSLLKHSETLKKPLVLPHRDSHADRLMTALEDRNRFVAHIGLSHWAHSCEGCFKKVVDVETGDICENSALFDMQACVVPHLTTQTPCPQL